MYKSVTFVVLLVLALGSAKPNNLHSNINLKDGLQDRGLFDGLINDTIQAVLADLPEPVEIPTINIDLPLEGILTLQFNLSDTQISGLKGLQVTYLETAGLLVPTGLDARVNIPSLDISFLYSVDAVVLNELTIRGNDSGSILLKNLAVNVSTDINLEGPDVLQNLQITIGLEELDSNINGLYIQDQDVSDLVNELLDYLIPLFLNTYQEEIGALVSPIIQDVINAILAGPEGEDIKIPGAPLKRLGGYKLH